MWVGPAVLCGWQTGEAGDSVGYPPGVLTDEGKTRTAELLSTQKQQSDNPTVVLTKTSRYAARHTSNINSSTNR